MATPIAKINVINQALIELGKQTVSNENDRQDSQVLSKKIDLLFPLLLRAAPWSFSIVYRQDSTPLSVNFSPDYTYSYQLPSDYGRMYKFGFNTPGYPYQINDGILQTNLNPIQYYYVLNDVPYDVISYNFYRALSIFAAADTAIVLTQNVQLAGYLKQKFEEAKSEAILEDSMEQFNVATQFNDFDRIMLL